MSITTNGWDLVYNMRFEALNRDLQLQFAEEDAQRHRLRETIAMALGGGLLPTFVAVPEQRGSGYTQPPTATVSYLDGSATLALPATLRVQSLRLVSAVGYTSLPATKRRRTRQPLAVTSCPYYTGI